MTTPTQVPDELTAGDTWEWVRELSDYPAPTWDTAWYFEKSDHSFDVAGVDSGTQHSATVAASTSVDIKVGRYRWTLLATSGSTRKTVESGWTEVLRNPAAAGNFDHRTTARRNLEMIEAYLADSGNLNAASYSLGGRSLSRWSRADLLVERDKWKAEARAEEAAERIGAGLGNPRRLYVRFDRG